MKRPWRIEYLPAQQRRPVWSRWTPDTWATAEAAIAAVASFRKVAWPQQQASAWRVRNRDTNEVRDA